MQARRLLRTGIIAAAILAVAGLAVTTVNATIREGHPDAEEHEEVTNNPLSTTGSCGVERWAVKTGLPTGLSINRSTGLISGTPTTAGTNTTTVTATDTTGASGSATFTWTINPSGGGGCAGGGQRLGNPGFETGTSAPWSGTTVINNSSTEPPHSGTWDAWLDGHGTTHTDTLTQTTTLPSGCTTYTLTFWLHTNTAETTTSTKYDTLTAQVLNGSGTVLSTLATFSNLDHNTGYAQHSYNLAAYAGQTITVKFTGAEDYTDQTSFVLDDTALTVS